MDNGGDDYDPSRNPFANGLDPDDVQWDDEDFPSPEEEGEIARREKASLDAALLAAGLHHHTGMVVLPSALRVEQSELVTPMLVQRALAVLEQAFTYIVVDLGVAMTEVTLGVLERANRILIMVTAELPTLKDTADLLQIFETVLDIPPARVSLILNHPRPQTMVTRADAERVRSLGEAGVGHRLFRRRSRAISASSVNRARAAPSASASMSRSASALPIHSSASTPRISRRRSGVMACRRARSVSRRRRVSSGALAIAFSRSAIAPSRSS